MSKIQYQEDGAQKVLKKFQEDGAQKAFKKLFEEDQNRYLLADEVGLGKTVTAAGVIAKLCEKWKDNPDKNIKIGYICANKALARQNIRKLKENIQEKIKEIEKEKQIKLMVTIDEKASEAERLSLGFLTLNGNSSDKKITLYTLTPSTTIKVVSDGTVKERAYVHHLIVGDSKDDFLEEKCKGRAESSFKGEKEAAKINFQKFEEKYQKSFQKEFLDKFQEEWDKQKDGILEKCIKESAATFIYRDSNKKYEYFSWKIFSEVNDSFSSNGIETILKKCEEELNNLEPNVNLEEEFKNLNRKEKEHYRNIINNVYGRTRENYMKVIKEDLLTIPKRYTLISYYEKIKEEINGSANGSLKILDDLIEKCKSDIGDDFDEGFSRGAINETVNKYIVKKIKDICCKEYIRIARKCMTILSISKMDIDLFIADEIQNYSDLFREHKEKYSEMDMLIQEIIGGNKKLMLMSATPFRYHSLLNNLENTEKDEDSDSNEDDNNDTLNEEKEEDKAQKYLEEDTDIYKEFKNIIGYLKDKDEFDFQTWEAINNRKFQAIKENTPDEYKCLIKEQETMLKEANVSRVERYMSGRNVEFTTVNKEIPTDKLLLQEVRNIPRTKMDILPYEEIEDGDKIISINIDNDYFIYHKEKFYYAPDEVLEEFFEYLDDEEYLDDWKYLDKSICDIKKDEYEMYFEPSDSKINVNKLKQEIQRDQVRLDYIKSTPALFSFKHGYKKLENMEDKTRKNKLSSDRIKEYKPVFAGLSNENNEDDQLIYNARIVCLFHQLFEKENLHKLLFIPPTHKSEDKELKGVYKDSYGVSKRLFFTDYNMTPQSLSALITYEASRRVMVDLKSKIEKMGSEVATISCLPEGEHNKEIDVSNLIDYCRSIDKIYKILFEYDKEHYSEGKRRYGSPYDYAMEKKQREMEEKQREMEESKCKKEAESKEMFKNDDEIRCFCEAYYKYMSRKSSLRILLAYTDADNIYDAILEYGENGCIWDVFDEYQDYITKDEGESFATAFKRILDIEFKQVYAETKGEKAYLWMNTDFASGHFSGDKNNVSSAKTLDNKLQRFNSPFWPFQFISTSIGQEGFDFHVYCRKVVHWSLEFNPVKFEQREGRINRYQGYANRLQLEALLKNKKIEFSGWKKAFSRVRNNEKKDCKIDEMINDGKGLFPDFVVPVLDVQYGLERECYYYPSSFESEEFDRVLEAVGYYRSLLGQSGSDTFEEEFERFVKGVSPTDLFEYFINLYPDPV